MKSTKVTMQDDESDEDDEHDDDGDNLDGGDYPRRGRRLQWTHLQLIPFAIAPVVLLIVHLL